MTIPNELPAMILPGTVLLPKTIMPLRIFEERYQLMLADSLGGDRIFAIANGVPDAADNDSISDSDRKQLVATVGLIRVSSQNPDGTSILMLEGTDRVRIEEVSQLTPYPILRVSKFPTTNRPQDEFEAEIVVVLLDKVDQLHELVAVDEDNANAACHAIDDLEMLAHFIMQTYCNSSVMMLRTLETTNLIERCKLVSDYLQLQIMLAEETGE
ncbi:LON peptidase substrate-binding domain-containing protein [Pelagicoccus sp. SDUM812002]|uniref:LON peptidase substrate-binding domain-containing protein n=1 Tax=Pelagicoccus sp. SDUM812002 TaxID=3041266 RepID=UPI00280F3EDA|nr:LON peptidase substrate-binding domain-containing protein [Pelagicoccus sp. SDUM812002]MDQ8185130.1 LON peptidase substrate-binding domain-containing protein [Pelagicoccus sp. SDUM812002]